MGIEIAARANSTSRTDILPSFMIDYPTISDLRKTFALPPAPANPENAASLPSWDTPKPSTPTDSSGSVLHHPMSRTDITDSDREDELVMVNLPVKDIYPAPSTKVVLLQGRSFSGKRPFFLIADGTGSIATYIHLPSFSSNMPVYGIDSPYLRCPSELTEQVGIPGAAVHIVTALIKFQSEGPFSIGGFSGGAMLGYEVCRQLAAAGRVVDSLLLIDMCCPRPPGSEAKSDVGWKIYESIARQTIGWDASDNTQQHLRALFTSVAAYHPPPMTVQERPLRTAIIWAKKGMIDRCAHDSRLMDVLAKSNIRTESFPGFIEDKEMGAIAWGLPHKTDSDLGPNG